MSGRAFREKIGRITIFFLGVVVGSGITVFFIGVGFALLRRISEQLLQGLAMIFLALGALLIGLPTVACAVAQVILRVPTGIKHESQNRQTTERSESTKENVEPEYEKN